jgi:hypothetical protein
MALPSYVIGTCFVTAGLAGFAFPNSLYESFGLPLKPSPSPQPAEQPTEDSAEPADAAVSPFLYAKSIRDVSCGLTFLLLGATGNTDGVQMLAYTVYLTGAADGWVVWRYGGKELRWKAWVHWIGTVGMAAWFWSTRQKGQ